MCSSDLGSSGPGAIIWAFDHHSGLILTFQRNLRADDVSLRPEFSTDLLNWRLAELRMTRSAGDGTAIETWSVPGAQAPAVFLRLRVTCP